MKKFEKLSRGEMKKVTGGLRPPGDGGVGQAYCSYSGNCPSWGPAGPYNPDTATGTAIATSYQWSADSWCLDHDCCTNVDCPGAIA